MVTRKFGKRFQRTLELQFATESLLQQNKNKLLARGKTSLPARTHAGGDV